MMGSVSKTLTIGLAVGNGTGLELVAVFKRVVSALSQYYNINVEFHQSLRVYHSYLSLLQVHDSQTHRYEETMQDATHFERFCKEEAKLGTCVLFRTAVSAQSLYLVRRNLAAIKIEQFSKGPVSLVLVRDQTQGFYTGSSTYDPNHEMITQTCHFSKRAMAQILEYSLQHARQVWGKGFAIETITMVYKHHLFEGIFDTWAKEWAVTFGIKIEFIQPDTMNRNLLAYGITGRRLVIASNEYADIMQLLFLEAFDQGSQEGQYAKNIYLHPDVYGLCEFQTVHGSADDLKGKDQVNPSATIRAAAAILDSHGGCHGAESAIDRILSRLLQEKSVTRDQGGLLSTSAFVDVVLRGFVAAMPSAVSPALTLDPEEVQQGKASAVTLTRTARCLRRQIPRL